MSEYIITKAKIGTEIHRYIVIPLLLAHHLPQIGEKAILIAGSQFLTNLGKRLLHAPAIDPERL